MRKGWFYILPKSVPTATLEDWNLFGNSMSKIKNVSTFGPLVITCTIYRFI